MNFAFRQTFTRFAQTQAASAASAASTKPLSSTPQINAAQQQLLFRITRTHTKNIPVYLSYAGGARRVPMTEVRRIEGDVNQCHGEIQRLVGSHVNVRRADNKLFVTGNFVSKIRNHLVAMGF